MTVVNAWCGAPTPAGFRVVSKVTSTASARLAVADNSGMSSPVFFGPVTPSSSPNFIAQLAATGLDPDARWWWAVEHDSVVDATFTGQARTLPVVGSQHSHRFGVASCAGSQPDTPGVGSVLSPSLLSNHEVFDTLSTRALAEEWQFFAHLGDLHYADFGDVTAESLANRRRFFDDVLLQPRQHLLYRSAPLAHAYDDHDFAEDNSDGTYASKANAAQVFRERVPHFPLSDADGIWQTWQVGRVRYVLPDVRYYRSPNADPDGPSKTMLGSAQLAWLETVLAADTGAEALIWLMPDEWLGTKEDSWGSFGFERDELVELHGDYGWLRRMVMACGDLHALGLATGVKQPWGRFPVLVAASLDSTPSRNNANSEMFDRLPVSAGRGQYGTVDVEDAGSHILIRMDAWRGETLMGSHTHGIVVEPSPAAAFPVEVLSGSHMATFEARVVTGQPTSADPEGVDLPIVGGDVQLDGTAQVRGTLSLETVGVDQSTGQSWFPRHATSLLGPYGNEVWVRRGVDLGSHVEWVSLGIFRIDGADQPESPFGPIQLSGSDRMAGIVDGRLLSPRTWEADTTVAELVSELVWEIYPHAVIIFDDDTGASPLGRQVVAEEDRYGVLLDVARSRSKIIYWDDVGALRIETAPDEDTVVWQVKAGRGGVLLNANRRVSRDGQHNALVATGEGQDDGGGVRGVAVDRGPTSPTRFGGPFGRVPRFYASPLLTTSAQAQAAAVAMLRRELGAPYNVDFDTVVNPALRPYDAVRVTQQDGNREVHVMETLTIPLSAQAAMSGGTREKTHIVVGALA